GCSYRNIITELEPSSVEASILTGGIREHNTFEEPENVKEKAFTEFKTEGRKISFSAPACSIISLRIK
ncbi:MAG: alpha-N-arabinofuranosidase, partial [Lachnospiraceae bacterium]|nr:alpha-N-arabinofuranosidase [Lachnospiraceae bacterium]